MGIYDRDYVRQAPRGFHLGSDLSMVAKLVIVNVVIYVLDYFTSPEGGLKWLSRLMAVDSGSLTHPLEWWKFLTYGFAHDPHAVAHIIGNMLTLAFLGSMVEDRYGRKEFLRIYLAAIVVAGLTWAAVDRLTPTPPSEDGITRAIVPMVGASGAVTAVVVLLALNFPKRTILLNFFIPVPAWALGAFYVLSDISGALGGSQSRVAFTAHLGGAAFAAAYFFSGLRLGNYLPSRISWPSFRRMKTRSQLRVHRPAVDDRRLSDEVDRILEKITREGEASLTAAERRTLQDASRHYQDRSKPS